MRAFKKGFTLIELLVVIGVLAVIAAGVVALINPQDKIAQANDSKVINDIGQYATALQSYSAQNNLRMHLPDMRLMNIQQLPVQTPGYADK
ncbi:MAG: hypothetical protein UX86_C0006G0012 [Candidatus Amesbacteria bacterium GW2011_GWC1_47_15]|uniref:Uncharacterized protein n=1 Tax=Candidatus Amesbacteria bacterium GW2011_GWC1_47_15 TaxID=1618364 RepID=A0A0G1S586_9BACT|nr:MAG: hypothetical protein UX86_C0006G0012 [Candidatus Amesbacteria bacterium GW2011_GWC1_47_15]